MMDSEVEADAWHHAAQVERSRLRALLQTSQETCRNIASAQQQLADVLSRTRELVAVSSHERMVRHHLACRIAGKPNDFLEIMHAVGISEAKLPAVVDALIELYEDATTSGDEETVALAGRALRHIGRHLAQKLGPRQSGVLLN